ncbi:MAG: SusE domain-containing protein [Ferruginibacter sp.]
MKKISQLLCLALLLITVLSSCKKDENRVIFNKGTAPVLSSSIAATIPLAFLNASKEAINLTWTNPEYQFNTGVSSYDVSYQVEIDTTGANFTNPDKKTISISKDLGISISQNDFNDYLLNQLKLVPAMSHNIEMRVKSFLIGNTGILYSNILKFKATPYAIPPKIDPPSTGQLFIVGDATNGGWNNPVPMPAQQFTKKDALHFEITLALNGGKEYLFLPLNGDWGHKYACKKKADQSPNGGDFGLDLGDNFPGPAASGNYKIEVDFQRGKYTVTKL